MTAHVVMMAANEEIAQKLARKAQLPFRFAATAEEACQALRTDGCDTLVIAALHGYGLDAATFAAENAECGVIVIGREELAADPALLAAQDAGVVFLPLPVAREALLAALTCAAGVKRRIAYLRSVSMARQRRQEEMQSIARAKQLLIQTLGMTEPQAHHFIERQAMDTRQTRAEVARRILKTYDNA